MSNQSLRNIHHYENTPFATPEPDNISPTTIICIDDLFITAQIPNQHETIPLPPQTNTPHAIFENSPSYIKEMMQFNDIPKNLQYIANAIRTGNAVFVTDGS